MSPMNAPGFGPGFERVYFPREAGFGLRLKMGRLRSKGGPSKAALMTSPSSPG